jgi:uncharacterized GH25 family protein
MDLDKPKRALHDLNTAVAICTSPAYAELLRSQQCWVTRRLKEAWAHVDKAIQLDPNDPRFYHFRAYIQSLLAEGPNDIESFKKENADYEKIMTNFNYKRLAIVYNNLGTSITHGSKDEILPYDRL